MAVSLTRRNLHQLMRQGDAGQQHRQIAQAPVYGVVLIVLAVGALFALLRQPSVKVCSAEV
jgi:hypothetical protein